MKFHQKPVLSIGSLQKKNKLGLELNFWCVKSQAQVMPLQHIPYQPPPFYYPYGLVPAGYPYYPSPSIPMQLAAANPTATTLGTPQETQQSSLSVHAIEKIKVSETSLLLMSLISPGTRVERGA
jgi:hypothetical protein